MRVVELIERKRDGGRLSDGEITWLIQNYTADKIPDYQMSAMLMAVLVNDLDHDELTTWVGAMLDSGDRLDLSSVKRPKVDKHSTGGVGDKISIPLGPLVAACGVALPMVSGRGLSHTGGTLDKLESIPGFNTDIEPQAFAQQLNKIGLVFAAQSKTLVPADRKIYALRDSSGTVPSIPLIASSIMSKKMAEDLNGLVLDVKIGRGAFMKDAKHARELAQTMVAIGKSYGVETVALLTDMDSPIGMEVGNANEITESILLLKGEAPEDLTELTFALGAEMLVMAGVANDDSEARQQLQNAISTGKALDTFANVIETQGGDPRVIDNDALLPKARHVHEITAVQSGSLATCDALQIGLAATELGAGRETKDDKIDPAVGITLLAKPGDKVEQDQVLAKIAWNDDARLAAALETLDSAWVISDEEFVKPLLVKGEVRA